MSLVYSTDGGRVCPGCRQPIAACVCGKKVIPVGDGIVRVSRETKGDHIGRVMEALKKAGSWPIKRAGG